MSFDYIRKHYGVPAKRGMNIEVYRLQGHSWVLSYIGTIKSVKEAWIKAEDSGYYHPRDGAVYYDDDWNVLCDTRTKER